MALLRARTEIPENHLGSWRVSFLLLLAGQFLLTASGQSALAQNEPTIAKDSVLVKAHHKNDGKGGHAWIPVIGFLVNGPIASGSQLWVEFGYPGNKSWVKFDCETGEISEGRWWKVEECFAPEKSINTYAGLVDFSIHMRNELQGANTTLFTGKLKVTRVPIVANNSVEYIVDEDWRIPIGFVFLEASTLHATMWFRGNWPFDSMGYLFYQGKQVAKVENYCSGALDVQDYFAKNMWGANECKFLNVYGADRPDGSSMDGAYDLRKNPGEYEVKVIAAGHLVRSLKFTVAADGTFDYSIATANKLGSQRVIVPIQVLGDQTVQWDHAAWKTGAFYGNPLTGFTAAK